MSPSTKEVDVVIVGAGPIGILTAYQLARFGCEPYLVEKQDKSNLPYYGRGCTLWPRSMELLDQLDLAEDLMQAGTITRSSKHYVEGKRVDGGILYASRMDKWGDTFYKFALHIRQRRIETIFTSALKRQGHQIYEQTEFQDYSFREDVKYPLEVRCKNLQNGTSYSIFAKYIVGCDGAGSVVRSLSQTGIQFQGDRTKHRWVRMDARVRTNMPSSRLLNSLQSPTHGQILWCPLDSGLTRIGYVFSQALIDKYGGVDDMTVDVIMAEAKDAIAPFEVDFESVDWWTIYGIGQRTASSLISPNDRVFLAGDACHTHSSGSAQGLNTGIHDTVNLSWKLAFSIKDVCPQPQSMLFTSYESERMSVIQKIIDNDKTISVLISGQYPERFKGRTESTTELLTQWFTDANMQSFTLGFGISYPRSPLNLLHGSVFSTVNPGDRGPDVFLTSIGTNDPIRLHKTLKNHGQFTFLVFAGEPHQTKPALERMRDTLQNDDFWLRKEFKAFADTIDWVTIIATTYTSGAQESLGMPAPPFDVSFSLPVSSSSNAEGSETQNKTSSVIEGTGSSASKEGGTVTFVSTTSSKRLPRHETNQGRVYIDPMRAAHDTYGVDVGLGAVILFRPDGYVAGVLGLDDVGSEEFRRWFTRILGEASTAHQG